MDAGRARRRLVDHMLEQMRAAHAYLDRAADALPKDEADRYRRRAGRILVTVNRLLAAADFDTEREHELVRERDRLHQRLT